MRQELPRAPDTRSSGVEALRVVALVDGEHYPPAVRAALDALPHDIVGAVFLGGSEKLRGGADYGVPLATSIEEAIERYHPDLVVDLSDEPVLGPDERLALVSRVLAHGVSYAGADFRFDPPVFAPYDLPSLAIIGTGKRVGKTALTVHLARLLAPERKVVVVAMGRGGPEEPEVVNAPPTIESLVALSRSGRHAASDHLEIAALSGVQSIGCRRAGGGMAGAVAFSNVIDGGRLAAELGPDLVLFDGSGAALPPIDVDRRILAISAGQEPGLATGYLNAYRLMLADLVVVTMAEEGSGGEELATRARRIVGEGVPIVRAVLRPRPATPIAGRRVAYFGTSRDEQLAAITASHLALYYGAEPVHVSGALADRRALAQELAEVDADLFLVELKAAAIDVVAEAAAARGIEVVLAGSDVVPVDDGDLDGELRRLASEAAA